MDCLIWLTLWIEKFISEWIVRLEIVVCYKEAVLRFDWAIFPLLCKISWKYKKPCLLQNVQTQFIVPNKMAVYTYQDTLRT